jgi:hypothetical protein
VLSGGITQRICERIPDVAWLTGVALTAGEARVTLVGAPPEDFVDVSTQPASRSNAMTRFARFKFIGTKTCAD